MRRRMREATEAEDAADDAMRAAAEQAEAQHTDPAPGPAADRGAAEQRTRSAQGETEPDQDGER